MIFGPLAKIVIVIAIFSITLSLALNLSWGQFLHVFKSPKKLITGSIAQVLLLPLMTYALVSIIQPDYKYALAMFFIAACPGGNTSNYISYLANASVPYSMSLTFFSSILSTFMTPFNMVFWASIYEPTAEHLQAIQIDRINIILSLLVLLVFPLALGMILNQKLGHKVELLKKVLEKSSLLVMLTLFGYTIYLNANLFDQDFKSIFSIVLIHNTLALLLGLTTAILARLTKKEQRTLTIEVGYQNTALALAVALSFFPEIPEIAFLIAWWTVWHNISALGLIVLCRASDHMNKVKQ
jgi:BASS family bile acid:Na+ symporter